jgi:poly-gamma-glutamate synthesis protein (capsule biosynthesis protein)
VITLALTGDVMTGRGIDQILPHPSDPALHEPYVRDARDYVVLAEHVNGGIAKPAALDYVWGAALEELDRLQPDARVVNLETSVTRSDTWWAAKDIHYRMSPENVGCLTAARVDCCTLANNHVLDWGHAGLAETIATLRSAGIRVAGAGRDAAEAASPAVLDFGARGRVLVVACGSPTSGIPASWAAGSDRPGIHWLPELGAASGSALGRALASARRPGDVVVVSVHWGANWGYGVPREQREFAHALVDSGAVDIVHGHSSHHAKGIEIYRGRLILYGCGDFLNDYEGIAGYEQYRADLSLLYVLGIEPAADREPRLQIVPLQIRRFRLERASREDTEWLQGMLERESGRGLRLAIDDHGSLVRA